MQMQCNAMQCNAMQCNAMQCNAMQCNGQKVTILLGRLFNKKKDFLEIWTLFILTKFHTSATSFEGPDVPIDATFRGDLIPNQVGIV
jgi:hypothetical protein